MAAAVILRKPPHPVLFGVEYKERQSRWKTFLRLILAIPQLIVVYLLQVALGVMTMIAWFAILFTGRYPRGLFNFNVGILRWQANVYAYVALLCDEYPPFTTEAGFYPLLLDIPYAERQSRIRLFLRIITIIPNYIVLNLVEFVWFFVLLLSWFCILIGGRTPRRLFGFGVGVMRWHVRQTAYLFLLRDEYPPYRFSSEAPPGNEVISGVIGAPMLAAYIAFYIIAYSGSFARGTDHVEVRVPLTSPALEGIASSGEGSGVRLTLLGYDDDAPRPSSVDPVLGYREVAFRLRAEKSGFWPAIFTPYFLEVHDCYGFTYSPEAVSDGFEVHFFLRGGSKTGSVLFQVPNDDDLCDLTYQFTGSIRFEFLGGM